MPNSEVLNIPIDVAKYVIRGRFCQAFRVYVFMQFKTSGLVHADKLQDLLSGEKGLKDPRTVKRHVDYLVSLGWLGRSKNGFLFIRGVKQLCRKHSFNPLRCAKLSPGNLSDLKTFLAGAVVNEALIRQKIYYEKFHSRNEGRTASEIKGKKTEAFYVLPQKSQKPTYYGYSNGRLAEFFGCTRSNASKVKKRAAELNLIRVVHKSTPFYSFLRRDKSIRESIYRHNKDLVGSLYYSTRTIKEAERIRTPQGPVWAEKGRKVIDLLHQEHDEIIPLMEITNRRIICKKYKINYKKSRLYAETRLYAERRGR